jgi:hypothetical protein
LGALCVEDWQASIGVAVHRFGKCAKVFLLAESQMKEGRSMLRRYKGIKKPPLV